LDAETIIVETSAMVERLAPFIADTSHFLNQAAAARRTILLEGAQATLLDVDHGTYPFVTSSSTTVGGACVGTGLAPKHITGVLDALEEIKVCVGYNLNGKKCDSFPSVSHDLRSVEPVYETLPGWKASTVGVTDLSELPRAAREYVNFLSNQIGVQIGLISTG